MATVNVYDAKTQLSKLLVRAEHGEQIIITRHGRPVAALGPVPESRPDRVPGAWRGQVTIAADFDDFTATDERDWYGQ
jgi:prevent-host-death family protein